MHAWEIGTAAQLLNDCCLPCGVHPSSATQQETFRLAAWCSDPDGIPPEIDLVLPEPNVAIGGASRERRCLLYPISIKVMRLAGQDFEDGSIPPPPPDDDGDIHRRRELRRPPPMAPSSSLTDVPRGSVHTRLGPRLAGSGPPLEASLWTPSALTRRPTALLTRLSMD